MEWARTLTMVFAVFALYFGFANCVTPLVELQIVFFGLSLFLANLSLVSVYYYFSLERSGNRVSFS